MKDKLEFHYQWLPVILPKNTKGGLQVVSGWSPDKFRCDNIASPHGMFIFWKNYRSQFWVTGSQLSQCFALRNWLLVQGRIIQIVLSVRNYTWEFLPTCATLNLFMFFYTIFSYVILGWYHLNLLMKIKETNFSLVQNSFFFSVKKVNNSFIPSYCDIIPK